jgi:hypothetical protein
MIDVYIKQEEATFKAHVKDAMADISYTNDQGIRGEIKQIYHLMSLPPHDGIDLSAAPVGFVVNKSKSFSVCLSALLRCFDVLLC